MKFKLEIDCDNEAFGDNMAMTFWELGRMLYALSKRVAETGSESGGMLDKNGNLVGKYWFEGKRDETD